MPFNPNLYEINTRVWIKQFGKDAKLHSVPSSVWQELANKGMDYVWLMGIWKTNESVIDKYCFEEGLIEDYNRALSDWKREDVIGSPYSIDKYEPNPGLMGLGNLQRLRDTLHSFDLKLILDFVPNHFSADTTLISTHPNIFLEANFDMFKKDPHTFFVSFQNPKKVFAHGRDPFFPAWQDTIQVNYFNPEAREFMIKTILDLVNVCDGIRCDMAMLNLNNIFENTWGGVLSKAGFDKPEKEFWEIAIQKAKEKRNDFLFIAEAYWDLGWDLQQLGFDYTYDKRLTERLINGYVPEIKSHLRAEEDYQKKLVRFLENHDEERAVSAFGQNKSKAAAVVTSTLLGMHFFHDGQFEGKKVKLPLQLGRAPIEKINVSIKKFYNTLLSITKNEIFKKGTWAFLEALPAWDGDFTYENILIWMWQKESEKRLIVINYTDSTSRTRIKFNVNEYSDKIEFHDLLHNKKYLRSKEEIITIGLFIELKSYESHIFAF